MFYATVVDFELLAVTIERVAKGSSKREWRTSRPARRAGGQITIARRVPEGPPSLRLAALAGMIAPRGCDRAEGGRGRLGLDYRRRPDAFAVRVAFAS